MRFPLFLAAMLVSGAAVAAAPVAPPVEQAVAPAVVIDDATCRPRTSPQQPSTPTPGETPKFDMPGGESVADDNPSPVAGIAAIVASLVAGAGAGVARQWKETHK